MADAFVRLESTTRTARLGNSINPYPTRTVPFYLHAENIAAQEPETGCTIILSRAAKAQMSARSVSRFYSGVLEEDRRRDER